MLGDARVTIKLLFQIVAVLGIVQWSAVLISAIIKWDWFSACPRFFMPRGFKLFEEGKVVLSRNQVIGRTAVFVAMFIVVLVISIFW